MCYRIKVLLQQREPSSCIVPGVAQAVIRHAVPSGLNGAQRMRQPLTVKIRVGSWTGLCSRYDCSRWQRVFTYVRYQSASPGARATSHWIGTVQGASLLPRGLRSVSFQAT